MIDYGFFDNNLMYEKILWIVVPAVLLALIVGFAIWRAFEDRKRKREQAWAAERRAIEVVDGIEERKDDGGKKIREYERAKKEAEKFTEKAAETTNTLIGGKSEAEREAELDKQAVKQNFGTLGISSRKLKNSTASTISWSLTVIFRNPTQHRSGLYIQTRLRQGANRRPSLILIQ